MRRGLRHAPVGAGATTAVPISSCSDGVDDVRSIPSAGWSSFGGNAQNSNFVYPRSATTHTVLVAAGRRSDLGSATISGRSNCRRHRWHDPGCNTFLFDPRAGRKNFCQHLAGGVELNSMLVDEYENIYLARRDFSGLTGSGDVRRRFGTVGVRFRRNSRPGSGPDGQSPGRSCCPTALR